MAPLGAALCLLAGCLDYDMLRGDGSVAAGATDAAAVDAALVGDGAHHEDAASGLDGAAIDASSGDAAASSPVVYDGQSQFTTSGFSSVTLHVPATASPGDYFVMGMRGASSSATITIDTTCVGGLQRLAGNGFVAAWCLHVIAAGDSQYVFSLSEATDVLGYAASYAHVGNTSVELGPSTYDSSSSQSFTTAPAHSLVVAAMMFENLAGGVPNWTAPTGFSTRMEFDGLVFFDGPLGSDDQPSFSFQGFDRGQMLAAFWALPP